MRRIVKKKFILVGMLLLFIGGWFLVVDETTKNQPVLWHKEDVIRLHVLANSDNLADQELKLKVRDEIIHYLEPYLHHVTNKNTAEQIILEHKKQLIERASLVIEKNGAHYPVDLQVGVFDFPIKSYGGILLPAGQYEAVRILIGKGEGQNWWCVLFPPLCFIDITNAAATFRNESSEDRKNTIEFKLKLAELWREYREEKN